MISRSSVLALIEDGMGSARGLVDVAPSPKARSHPDRPPAWHIPLPLRSGSLPFP